MTDRFWKRPPHFSLRFPGWMFVFLFTLCSAAHAVSYTAVPVGGPAAPIVLYYDSSTGDGINWATLDTSVINRSKDDGAIYRGIIFAQRAVEEMTGYQPSILSQTNISSGLVFILMQDAPSSISTDSAIIAALADDGSDPYNHKEAFYIRSEAGRVLVVANTTHGLANGVVALMDSVDYHVLGMGPNWTHIPTIYHSSLTSPQALVFDLDMSDRPDFYIRAMVSAGWSGTKGLIPEAVTGLDPDDEHVFSAYNHMEIGTRRLQRSAPLHPGHALALIHNAAITEMRAGPLLTEGFLAPDIQHGLDASRPAASSSNARQLWFNTDTSGPQAGKIFFSNGTTWIEEPFAPNFLTKVSLDITLGWVRDLILADMKNKAETAFENNPDSWFVYGTDPEDGSGYNHFTDDMINPDWYPVYMGWSNSSGTYTSTIDYDLHNYKGLNQPKEIWDANSVSDHVYALNNWLLDAFDAWIDSLPAGNDDFSTTPPTYRKNTSTGQSKKALVRCDMYSYNYHDVPPNFNLDSRIRLQVASFPKNRGFGKWSFIRTQTDAAEALNELLGEAPGYYQILTYSLVTDWGTNNLLPVLSTDPANIRDRVRSLYDAGIRDYFAEASFNQGKFGLFYYLLQRLFWNATMTQTEVETVRDNWMSMSFGPAASAMTDYYDYIDPTNTVFNGPNFWAKAIDLIDIADADLAAAVTAGTIPADSDYQKRVDDVKLYWYFYYLQDTDQHLSPFTAAMHEFTWKSQMSYMNSMFAATSRIYSQNDLQLISQLSPTYLDAGVAQEPAHYTHAQTSTWWSTIQSHWVYTPVTNFADAGNTLADGTPTNSIDLNDLVSVNEFRGDSYDPNCQPFYYNGSSTGKKPYRVLTIASQDDEEIGFRLTWPNPSLYPIVEIPYSVEYWNTTTQEWELKTDPNFPPVATGGVIAGANSWTGADLGQVEGRYTAALAGTYRIQIEKGGGPNYLASLAFDAAVGPGEVDDIKGLCFGDTGTSYQTQVGASPTYFYIPRGTTTLDFEVWSPASGGTNTLRLYNGLQAIAANETRSININTVGTYTIALDPEETGSIAAFQHGGGLSIPFLYSVPMLWACSPSALLIPRAVAEADGLTISTHFPDQAVDHFSDADLADGTDARTIDQYDLVGISEFQTDTYDTFQAFLFNSSLQPARRFVNIATTAGQDVGCKLTWNDFYGAVNVSYDIERWDSFLREWTSVLTSPPATISPTLIPGTSTWTGVARYEADIRVTTTQTGTYRCTIEPSTLGVFMADLAFDIAAGPAYVNDSRGPTFFETGPYTVSQMWLSPVYFYIPEDTAHLDIEVWKVPDASNPPKIILYDGLPGSSPTVSRTLSFSTVGTHRIVLTDGTGSTADETGTIAAYQGSGFAMPHLYSVPLLWATSPSALMVPRDIANADGLTILP